MEYLPYFLLIFPFWMGLVMLLMLKFAYKRATPQRALVRSGMGGTRAVVNGGVLAFPHLNDVTWVNMNAMSFEVQCHAHDALAFEDGKWQGRAQCVVRVMPHEVAVIQAATTWGEKTLQPSQLQPLLEIRLIEALQNAARHHERAHIGQRTGWNDEVQAAFAALETNGLQLESVRMTEAPCD